MINIVLVDKCATLKNAKIKDTIAMRFKTNKIVLRSYLSEIFPTGYWKIAPTKTFTKTKIEI